MKSMVQCVSQTAKPFREQTTVVRLRTYSPRTILAMILEELRQGKSTGQLQINLSQGGISSITFQESETLPI